MIAVRRLFAGAVAVVAAGLLPASVAEAQWWQGQSLCANSNLSVCASVTVSWNATYSQLTVTVLNSGTNGSLSTIGLFNNPPNWSGSWTLASATSTTRGNVSSYWDEGTQSLGNAIEWGVNRTGAASRGVQAGEQVTFVINFTPGFMVDANTQVAWHAVQLQVSEKCITGTTGEHACSIVPEPVSMVLLGTGLAGLGGVGAIRRRRKGLDVENG